MLKNIKSSYFIQLVYTYVEFAQKLKLIKYNKYLQNLTGIHFSNYKYFSGKYIIYESNGIGKEYDGHNDILIYEGEYLNGQRNGKGKEYWKDGKLKFEGEYLNGKRNGKGKEYTYYYNQLIFEGEYLNGKKNGKGKEYWKDGKMKIKFEGEYLNDKEWIGTCKYDDKIIFKLDNNINGKGKEYFHDGKLKFEGEYLNGKRRKGKKYYYEGNLEFKGEYIISDLEWTGKGYDKMNNIIYEIKDGKGLIKKLHPLLDKLSFEVEYFNGKKYGKGKEYNVFGGLIFEGEYLNGKKNGKGKEYYDYGPLKFEGEYTFGYKLKGKLYINNNLEYEGEYLYDKKWNGKGYDENGNVIYELINGNGKVKEYNYDGIIEFEGEYLNGKRNGKGKEYNYDGTLKFEGEYLNGKRKA